MYATKNIEDLIAGLTQARDGFRLAAVAELEAAELCVENGLDQNQVKYHTEMARDYVSIADHLDEVIDANKAELRTGTY